MKTYQDFGIYDFSDYAEEITGEDLIKINGGSSSCGGGGPGNGGSSAASGGSGSKGSGSSSIGASSGSCGGGGSPSVPSGSSGNSGSGFSTSGFGSGSAPSSGTGSCGGSISSGTPSGYNPGPTPTPQSNPDISDEIKSNPYAYAAYMAKQGQAKAEGDPDKYKGYNVLSSEKNSKEEIQSHSLSPKEQYYAAINCEKFGNNMLVPINADINNNIAIAKNMNIVEFYESVRNKGVWDYKQLDSKYENFGNFNYGVTGRAMGIPREILLRGAGYASIKADPARKENFGNWYGKPPYGDDPKDQLLIIQGMNYYDQNN